MCYCVLHSEVTVQLRMNCKAMDSIIHLRLKKNIKILLLEESTQTGCLQNKSLSVSLPTQSQQYNLDRVEYVPRISDNFRFRSTKPYSFKWLLHETISRRSTEMPLKKRVYGCGWGLLTPTDCNPTPLQHDSLCRNYTLKSEDSCQHSWQVSHWPSRTRSTSCACKIDWPVKHGKQRSCRSMATTSFLKILLRLITNH